MNSSDQNELSEVKKRILAKKKVQEEMDDLRSKIKDLRKQESQGSSVERDIQSYLDYLKVLKKERDSIKEGTHTTFLDAKKLISPKLNYGSRKEEVLAKIKALTKKIRAMEKSLAGGGYDTAQRADFDVHLISLKEKHQEALLELKSIEQFNHTRFLEQKESAQVNDSEENAVLDASLETGQPEQSREPLKQKPLPPKNTDNFDNFTPPPMI